MVKIFISGLSKNITEDKLKEIFAQAGQIKHVSIIKDKITGQPKGCALIDMGKKDDISRAIEMLNGKDFSGNKLKVAAVKPIEIN